MKALVEGMKLRRLPAREGAQDPLALAWAAADDPADMVELLQIGSALKLYTVDGMQTRGLAGSLRWLFRLRTGEGRYLRMDFTSEQGADGVRALLPEIEPFDAWAAAIEAERAGIADPIALLCWDLRRTGRVDPRWLARWTMQSAWDAASDSLSMRWVLELLGLGEVARAAQRAIDTATPPPREHRGEWAPMSVLQADMDAHDAWLAATIRAALPVPPAIPSALLPDAPWRGRPGLTSGP